MNVCRPGSLAIANLKRCKDFEGQVFARLDVWSCNRRRLFYQVVLESIQLRSVTGGNNFDLSGAVSHPPGQTVKVGESVDKRPKTNALDHSRQPPTRGTGTATLRVRAHC